MDFYLYKMKYQIINVDSNIYVSATNIDEVLANFASGVEVETELLEVA